jgi:hypothetical protein
MNAEQARQVAAALRRLGIPGVLAPETPDERSSLWRVYDTADPASRRDVTPAALAAVVAAFPTPPGPPAASSSLTDRTRIG